MKPSNIISTIALLSACTSAWPWPPSILQDAQGLSVPEWMGKRQDNGNGGNSGNNNNNNNNNQGSNSGSGNAGSSASPASSPDPTPAPTDAPKSTGRGDSTITLGPTSGDSSKGNSTDKPTSTLAPVNLQDPAGGVSMITPNALAGAQYYKIGLGAPITFAWNYTSLLRPPANINVIATASAPTPGAPAPSAYTIASNLTFDTTQTVTWDTEKFISTQPLPMGTYTLIVYDAAAEGGATALPSPGHLGTYNQFTFGMYTPQERVDLTPAFDCVTCNAAGGNIERLAFKFMFSMCGITIASFFWFTGGIAGLL